MGHGTLEVSLVIATGCGSHDRGRLLRELRHDHIVTCLDVFEARIAGCSDLSPKDGIFWGWWKVNFFAVGCSQTLHLLRTVLAFEYVPHEANLTSVGYCPKWSLIHAKFVCCSWRADRIFKGSFELRGSNLLKDDFLHFGQLSPWIVSAIAGSLLQPSWDPPMPKSTLCRCVRKWTCCTLLWNMLLGAT